MNSLEEYGALFQQLGLTEMVVEEGDFKLKLRKGIGEYADVTKHGSMRPEGTDDSTNSRMNVVQDGRSSVKSAGIDGEEIKAPLLGIFYAASGDNKAVKEGDTVKEGDVLCTIEAMKMMNEVKSTKSGVISKVCAKEGDLVEYNQTLFVVKAS